MEALSSVTPVPSGLSMTSSEVQVTQATNLSELKAKQRGIWSSGNYAVIGTTLQIIGELLCEAADLHAGSIVLDVAAGNGNASLAAARRGCRVTSTDYVLALLEQGRHRAEADGYTLVFREADAENLPFADGSFDAVLSTVGVMFTPDQQRAAEELARVCKPGGVIALANWTPGGFVGRIFKTLGRYLPPPVGVRSPALWGTEERIHELFPDANQVKVTRRFFKFRALSAVHWLDEFKTFYGPMLKAFSSIDAENQTCLANDLLALCAELNQSGDATLVVPSEYLEVVITNSL